MIIVWISVLNDNEKELVNQLFKDTNIILYNISLKYLHSHSDAEDAISQSFLKIIDHIEKISLLPPSQQLPYCVVVTKNVCLDILRKRKTTATTIYYDIDENETGIEQTVWSKMERSELLCSMDSLSGDERKLIQLRYANEMSYKEIATFFGISEETAKKKGQRALSKLRKNYIERGTNACT